MLLASIVIARDELSKLLWIVDCGLWIVEICQNQNIVFLHFFFTILPELDFFHCSLFRSGQMIHHPQE